MEYMFISILNMGITAGWLILAVALLRAVLRNIPGSLRCMLWGFVGIRLTVPWLPRTMFSLVPSTQTIRPDFVYQEEPAIHSGIPALNQIVNAVLSESFAPKADASANPLQIWMFFLSIVWVTGMLMMIIYAAVRYWRLHRKVRNSIKWKENIYFCDDIEVPFILGAVRPRVYLPSSLDAEQAVYAELHEQAHLARLDHLWKSLGFILLAVYWFHLLCWAAYWLLCKDLESACDERVVREFDADSREKYSNALLEYSANHSRTAACPFAFGEINVKRRIRNVLAYKKPAVWNTVIAFVLCIMTAVCFLTNLQN